MDHASLLILRALAGETGKVEIGGRRYTFSCIPIFRLRDEESGRCHESRDTSTLLRTIQSLIETIPVHELARSNKSF
ncbi:MAG TPA: hypothetical protein VFG76_13075 [Candidatus Polarisedimenticolia bacterium]|nr:hypothetical protein [Candidatus Polarisedimenticolia bacterium]